DAEPNGGLTVEAEHWLRWIGIAARHGGDIAQTEEVPAGNEIDPPQVGLGLETASHPHENFFILRLHDPRRNDRVLILQGTDDRLLVHPQPSEPPHRKFDVDALVLRAEDVYLRDILHLQQPGPHLLHAVAQLAMSEAVSGKGIDDAVGIAELVEERA